MRLIAESTLKCDRVDAEVLARFSRLDPALVPPVYQRSQEAQELRTRLRVRQSLVRMRTGLINAVRGTLRAHGYRMGSATAKRFVGPYADYAINAIFFENYTNAGSPQTQERYFDDIVVSTEPIACAPAGPLFTDGFESGDTSAWSSTVG